MSYCQSSYAFGEFTGSGPIFFNSDTGVRTTFYRSQAYILPAVTGSGRIFYRSLAYIFLRNLLINHPFWKHILLTMMLRKLKNITKGIDAVSLFSGEGKCL